MKRNANTIGTFLLLALVLLLLPTSWGDRLRFVSWLPIAVFASDEPPGAEAADAMHAYQLLQRIGELEARLDLASRYDSVEQPSPMISARIFLRGDSSAWRRSAYINLGSDHYLAEGMAVADRHGLLGLVAKVFPRYSRLTLLTDPAVKVRASVETDPAGSDHRTDPGLQGPERFFGTVEAEPDGSLYLRSIPIGTVVKPGDPVFSSGLGGALPRGIPIGVVLAVHTNTNGLTQQVRLRPLAHLLSAESVVVFLQQPFVLDGNDLPEPSP